MSDIPSAIRHEHTLKSYIKYAYVLQSALESGEFIFSPSDPVIFPKGALTQGTCTMQLRAAIRAKKLYDHQIDESPLNTAKADNFSVRSLIDGRIEVTYKEKTNAVANATAATVNLKKLYNFALDRDETIKMFSLVTPSHSRRIKVQYSGDAMEDEIRGIAKSINPLIFFSYDVAFFETILILELHKED